MKVKFKKYALNILACQFSEFRIKKIQEHIYLSAETTAAAVDVVKNRFLALGLILWNPRTMQLA